MAELNIILLYRSHLAIAMDTRHVYTNREPSLYLEPAATQGASISKCM